MIIDGKKVANNLLMALKEKHEILKAKINRPATLTVILVGDDDASKIYVRNKENACKKVGIKSNTIILPSNTQKEELIEVIRKENNNPDVDAILLQLPLPKHLDQIEISSYIDYRKDVDGFTPINLGKMMLNKSGIRPCTAVGVIKLLEEYGVNIAGADVVIIGRSNIVGKPLSIMLTNLSATVQVCHSKTKNIDEKIANADILITASRLS
ncbi:bifunctional 5,10-methylenetetrahydrofolate dehydrogenase/5,10-methenyltetrahydrofolate cyclohydrolase [Sneathia vaginalis]|uniref:bifunctional 5,10-methylenetetrahydrofolate dehydrogenase/5,10-methenyltetrahydrofolate cyclohydrolase n=1 Tax=Sneathia vaginalis TaxID=187101 RepID=UPI00370DA6DC